MANEIEMWKPVGVTNAKRWKEKQELSLTRQYQLKRVSKWKKIALLEQSKRSDGHTGSDGDLLNKQVRAKDFEKVGAF